MNSIPTVYFPGASGRSSTFHRLVHELRHEVAPVLVVYPGLGDAPPNPAIATLSDLYDFVLATLPERFDLVAMSMGGVLALRAALECPHRVRRLVLLATTGGVDVATLGAVDWRTEWASPKADAPRWFVDDRSNYMERLRELDVPTLLIFGDADPWAPPSVGKFLRPHIRGSTLEIVKGGTHDLEHDHAPLLASAIRRHLYGA
jgi:pimeloyl-ACP methyl ester carboxylesterase